MIETAYPRERTALLFVDPYNDFLSEGGKIYPRLKAVANEVGLLDNLRRLNGAVRGQSGLRSCRIGAGSRAITRNGAIPTPPSFRS
jgi:hypothetical protein